MDAQHWQAYDVYSVALSLLRVLFRPLWSTRHFTAFLEVLSLLALLVQKYRLEVLVGQHVSLLALLVRENNC